MVLSFCDCTADIVNVILLYMLSVFICVTFLNVNCCLVRQPLNCRMHDILIMCLCWCSPSMSALSSLSLSVWMPGMNCCSAFGLHSLDGLCCISFYESSKPYKFVLQMTPLCHPHEVVPSLLNW